jgi:hypothetical protein
MNETEKKRQKRKTAHVFTAHKGEKKSSREILPKF